MRTLVRRALKVCGVVVASLAMTKCGYMYPHSVPKVYQDVGVWLISGLGLEDEAALNAELNYALVASLLTVSVLAWVGYLAIRWVRNLLARRPQ